MWICCGSPKRGVCLSGSCELKGDMPPWLHTDEYVEIVSSRWTGSLRDSRQDSPGQCAAFLYHIYLPVRCYLLKHLELGSCGDYTHFSYVRFISDICLFSLVIVFRDSSIPVVLASYCIKLYLGCRVYVSWSAFTHHLRHCPPPRSRTRHLRHLRRRHLLPHLRHRA